MNPLQAIPQHTFYLQYQGVQATAVGQLKKSMDQVGKYQRNMVQNQTETQRE